MLNKNFCSSGIILPCCSHISNGFPCWWDWWTAIPTTKQPSGWSVIHSVCTSSVDNCYLRTFCRKSLSPSLL